MKEIIVLLRGNINFDSRVQKEIDTLIRQGFQVTLLVWNFAPVSFKRESLNIINVNFGKQRNPYGSFFTFLNIIRFWNNAAKLIKKNNFYYIHCNDLNTLGVIFFLPSTYYDRIIYDAHELFPENTKAKSIQNLIWNLIERNLIRKVGKIICPENNRALYLFEKYKLKRKIYVISNFPVFCHVNPVNIKKWIKAPSDSIILNYLGMLDANREIECIIKSLKFLPEKYIFLIIGFAFDRNYKNKLISLVKKLKLENRVFFYGEILSEKVLETIAACDIGIALYRNTNFNNYYCAPNKVFDYIMAGVKIITNDYPSLMMLNKYSFVRLISEVDAKSIADCILDLSCEKSDIPDKVKREFSWDSFEEVFTEIYY